MKRHVRKQVSDGNPDDVVYLHDEKKKAWDTLFAGKPVTEIAGIMNTIIDPDYELIVIKKAPRRRNARR